MVCLKMIIAFTFLPDAVNGFQALPKRWIVERTSLGYTQFPAIKQGLRVFSCDQHQDDLRGNAPLVVSAPCSIMVFQMTAKQFLAVEIPAGFKHISPERLPITIGKAYGVPQLAIRRFYQNLQFIIRRSGTICICD
jgi:hypothetical protein